MKLKKYENYTYMIFLSLIIFIVEIVFIIFLYSHKEYSYKKLIGIKINKNQILLVLTKKERSILYKNEKLLIDNKDLKYNIINDTNIINENNKKYYEIIIKCQLSTKYKTKESIHISIKDEKFRIIEIFKIILDGD